MFKSVAVFLLFLYGYGQFLSQDYNVFVTKSDFQSIEKSVNKSSLYKEVSSTSFIKNKITLTDFELDEDETTSSRNNSISNNYFLSFLEIQFSGNGFRFIKNNLCFFKHKHSSIFDRKYIMFNVFRL